MYIDGRADYYEGSVVSVRDYYPFGYQMPSRTIQSNSYRYGFNGKEKDQNGEWGGEFRELYSDGPAPLIDYVSQTHYDYGFRIYNPSIARFLSVDPLFQTYPFYTPYQFAGNKPIFAIDLDGLEEDQAIVAPPVVTPKIVPPPPPAPPAPPEVPKASVLRKIGEKVVQGGKNVVKGVGTAGAMVIGFMLIPTTANAPGTIFDLPGYYDDPEPLPIEPFRVDPPAAPVDGTRVEPVPTPEFDPTPFPVNTPEDDDEPEYVYRGGSFSDMNFTPRPGKDDGVGPKSGLSTFTTHEKATFGKGGKSQKLSVKALRSAGFVVTTTPDGHAGVRPASQESLEQWARTRPGLQKGENSDILTKAAKAARVEEVRTPKLNL